MRGPCKDCPDRVVGCHSKCEKYKKFVEVCKQERHKRLVDQWSFRYKPQKPTK